MKKRTVVDLPSEFDVSELFYSTTDGRGVIQSGNDVFVRVSEYRKDEIIGKPHSLIRHPDMPRAVFRLLWRTIQSGAPIVAYVKNRSSSGRYYWVIAYVLPIHGGGYLSIRIKPTSSLFSKITKLYKEMLDAEEQAGMDQGELILLNQIKELGFETYESFMIYALAEELKAADLIMEERAAQDSAQSTKSGRHSNKKLDAARVELERFQHTLQEAVQVNQYIFSKVDRFTQTGTLLAERLRMISGLKTNLQYTSINTAIHSEKMGVRGATLAVVADLIHKTALDTSEQVKLIQEVAAGLIVDAREVSLNISAAKIQMEMMRRFIAEMSEAAGGDAEASGGEGASGMRDECETLLEALRQCMKTVTSRLQTFANGLSKLGEQVQRLEQMVLTLEFAKKSGMIEARRIGGEGDVFSGILAAVEELIKHERNQLGLFSKALKTTSDTAKDCQLVGAKLTKIFEGARCPAV